MIIVLNQIALDWWKWMSSMIWQVSLLIIVIFAVDAVIRKWVWPQVRYALWIIVLIKLILPPTWSSQNSISSLVQPVVRKTLNGQFAVFSGDITRKQIPSRITFPTPTNVARVAQDIQKRGDKLTPEDIKSLKSKEAPKANWQVFAMATWILGMLIFITMLTIKIKKLHEWHRQQKERKTIPVWFHELLLQTSKRLKMQRLPAIVFSDQAVTPAIYGIFHPVLLFPANYFDNLSHKEAEHVLLHELSHIKRGDLLLHALTLALQIIYWFNPLLLWVRKHIKHIREICCDLSVAHILKEKTKEYRQTLVDTARELLTESVEPGMGLLGVFEEPFRLVARLKWLEKTTWQNYWLKIATAFMVVIVMVIFILPMAEVNYAMEESPMISIVNTDNDSNIEKKEDNQISNIAVKQEGMVEAKEDVKESKDVSQSQKWEDIDQSDPVLGVKESESFHAVVLPYKGPGAQISEHMHKVQQLLKRKNIQPSGPAMIRQFTPSGITPEDERLWEVGYPISEKIAVEQPFKVITNASTLVAYSHITGKFEEDEFNKRGAQWFYENGFWPKGAALIFCPDKLYNNWMTRDKWEFQIPVEKVTKSFPQVEVFTKWTEPIVALILPMHGFTDQDQEAYQKLQAYLTENNIIPTGDPFYRFYSDPNVFPLDEIIWEVGIAVPKGTGAKSPFEIKYIPEQLVAYSTVECAYEDIDIHWKAFGLLAQSKGYFMTGAPMRFMKNGTFEGICVNEFRHPIRRMRHTSQSLPVF